MNTNYVLPSSSGLRAERSCKHSQFQYAVRNHVPNAHCCHSVLYRLCGRILYDEDKMNKITDNYDCKLPSHPDYRRYTIPTGSRKSDVARPYRHTLNKI